jgi:hypothetical protein
VKVSIHESAPTPFTLESAILLYRTPQTQRTTAKTTAMHHPVRQDAGGALRFGEGTPARRGSSTACESCSMRRR